MSFVPAQMGIKVYFRFLCSFYNAPSFSSTVSVCDEVERSRTIICIYFQCRSIINSRQNRKLGKISSHHSAKDSAAPPFSQTNAKVSIRFLVAIEFLVHLGLDWCDAMRTSNSESAPLKPHAWFLNCCCFRIRRRSDHHPLEMFLNDFTRHTLFGTLLKLTSQSIPPLGI